MGERARRPGAGLIGTANGGEEGEGGEHFSTLYSIERWSRFEEKKRKRESDELELDSIVFLRVALNVHPLSPLPFSPFLSLLSSPSHHVESLIPRVEEGQFLSPILGRKGRKEKEQPQPPVARVSSLLLSFLLPFSLLSSLLFSASRTLTVTRCRSRLQFMDKRILIHVQGGRKVTGVLRGFDIFLNLVVDDASDESTAGDKKSIGMVVSTACLVHLDVGGWALEGERGGGGRREGRRRRGEGKGRSWTVRKELKGRQESSLDLYALCWEAKRRC